MFKTLILSILLCVVASASYAASAPCASPDKMDEYLLSTFKEKKVWVGITSKSDKTQQLTFLYENSETGGWTIAFYNMEKNITCVIYGGESSTYISTKTKGSKL
jgi:hypothetical protein|tara:strand:+ start:315 stop:626 length:312 start_codon:yes stop_codon:yes gene_type:complete